MDEILELATKLGKRMAADPRAQRMAAARAALGHSADDRRLLEDYEEQQRRVGQLQVERRLADPHSRIVGSEVIKSLLKAQADYVELMNAVSQRIEQETIGEAGPPQ